MQTLINQIVPLKFVPDLQFPQDVPGYLHVCFIWCQYRYFSYSFM